MTTLLRSIGALAAVLAVAASVPVSGQPKTATSASATNKWTSLRTAWGDPDLQEIWTSEDVRDIPYERPEQFAGRFS